MEFYEVVFKRRSIRKFREEKVSEEVLNRILEAARWAPSAGNTQPWHFIIITKPKIKQKIAEICTKYSRKHWKEFPTEIACYLAARGGSWDKSAMAKIPVLIAVCYENPKGMRHELILGSVWAAIENMLLAATAEGLGSCIYTYYNVEEENEIKRILHVPKEYGIAAIIQLGYAAIQPSPSTRKPLKEITHQQHF